MKTNSFLVGAILGAAATVAITKKFFKCCSCNENEACDNPVIKDADDAVEKLRNSVDSLRKELNSRIESEQTYAAKCRADLRRQVRRPQGSGGQAERRNQQPQEHLRNAG